MGARVKAWCLLIHAEASLALSLSLSLSEVRWMMWRATSAMPYLLEQMLRSSHRTLHPEEAAGAYTRPLLSST